MTLPYEATGVVLAGGDSRRMGRPKAGLDVGGESLVGRVVRILQTLCAEVLIVTKSPLDFLEFNTKIVRDLIPGQGPLGGLATGLFYSRRPWVLTLACDLPCLKSDLLVLLLETARAAPAGPRVIVPRTKDGWQPLVAVYSPLCLKPIRRYLQSGGRKVDEIRRHGVIWHEVGEDQLRAVDPDLESFTNINTPEELELVRSHL